MLSQTAVFTRRVGDHMIPASVIAGTATGCAEVVAQLRAAAATAAVIAEKNNIVGIVTEQDISRRAAFTVSDDTPVAEIMTTPVQTIARDDYLHHALARMRRSHIRHLAVVDEHGGVVGMLELERVLSEISDQTVAHIDWVDHVAGKPDTLRSAKQNQYRIASRLLADEVPAPEVQNLLTRLNHELYHATVEQCIDEMAASWGPPPAAFDIIVMGSGGRGENYLTPDQDNGIIIEDYPDEQHGRIDGWFIELSARMNQALNDIGFPFCKGHVMARNPLWRKTLGQWRQQVNAWIGKSVGNYLRFCDIFFDFACVHGSGQLSAQLREHITLHAAQRFFLREMFKIDEDHKVALGPFGWLLTEREKGPGKGKLNLKITGTLPLVGAVRIFALLYKIDTTSTLLRISDLFRCNAISTDEKDELDDAYRHISYLLLRQQLRDAQAGLAPGNHVSPKNLTKLEKRRLVAAFRAIRTFRSKVRIELTGELF